MTVKYRTRLTVLLAHNMTPLAEYAGGVLLFSAYYPPLLPNDIVSGNKMFEEMQIMSKNVRISLVIFTKETYNFCVCI